MMTQVLRSFLIPLAGNQLAKAGALQGNVVEWLGASLSPQGLILGTICEEPEKPKSGLILPNGQRPADPSAPRWLFQVLMDGEQPPSKVIIRPASYMGVQPPDIRLHPILAGYAGGFFIYVIPDISDEPGVTVNHS